MGRGEKKCRIIARRLRRRARAFLDFRSTIHRSLILLAQRARAAYDNWTAHSRHTDWLSKCWCLWIQERIILSGCYLHAAAATREAWVCVLFKFLAVSPLCSISNLSRIETEAAFVSASIDLIVCWLDFQNVIYYLFGCQSNWFMLSLKFFKVSRWYINTKTFLVEIWQETDVLFVQLIFNIIQCQSQRWTNLVQSQLGNHRITTLKKW
jgi:hypothetical protein